MSAKISPATSSRQVRTKDKLKHSRNETRRRARIRDQFDSLKCAIECDKKDRYNILQAAVEVVGSYQVRIAQLEQLVLKYEAATKQRFRVSPLPPSLMQSLPSTAAVNAAAAKRKRSDSTTRKKRRRSDEDDDEEEEEEEEQSEDETEEGQTTVDPRAPHLDTENDISEPESDDDLQRRTVVRAVPSTTISVGSTLSTQPLGASLNLLQGAQTSSAAVNVLATLAHVASSSSSTSTHMQSTLPVGMTKIAKPLSRKVSPAGSQAGSQPGSAHSSNSSKKRRIEDELAKEETNSPSVGPALGQLQILSPLNQLRPLSSPGLSTPTQGVAVLTPGSSLSFPVMSSNGAPTTLMSGGMMPFTSFGQAQADMQNKFMQQQQQQRLQMNSTGSMGAMAMPFHFFPAQSPYGTMTMATMAPTGAYMGIINADFAQHQQQAQQQQQQQQQQAAQQQQAMSQQHAQQQQQQQQQVQLPQHSTSSHPLSFVGGSGAFFQPTTVTAAS